MYSSSAAETEVILYRPTCPNMAFLCYVAEAYAHLSLSCPDLCKGDAESGMAQFEEMMRQQLESSMHSELEKLLDTTTGPEKEVRS